MPKSKKRSVAVMPKPRDSSWKLRQALGHKVEPNPKTYKRRDKQTKPLVEDEAE